jgi:16S rRNA (guanine527-N7)-methyltransferase
MTQPGTAPPEEPVGAVTALFGDRADVARSFWRHLSTSAVERGLIGPREVPRLWDRHILNCVSISAFVPADAALADVGSGAGLPGVAIAIARPDVHVTLVEPLQRRVVWLSEVVADLELGNVEVVRARAEELHGRFQVDVATARAVAALPVLAGWCLPLVRPGGRLLALKGRTAAEELAGAADELRALGAVEWHIRMAGVGVLDEPTTVVEVVAGAMPEPSAAGRGSSGRSKRRKAGEPEGESRRRSSARPRRQR